MVGKWCRYTVYRFKKGRNMKKTNEIINERNMSCFAAMLTSTLSGMWFRSILQKKNTGNSPRCFPPYVFHREIRALAPPRSRKKSLHTGNFEEKKKTSRNSVKHCKAFWRSSSKLRGCEVSPHPRSLTAKKPWKIMVWKIILSFWDGLSIRGYVKLLGRRNILCYRPLAPYKEIVATLSYVKITPFQTPAK